MSVSAVEFAALMARFALPEGGRMALAVSGGPDSMALAVLVRQWCADKQFPPPSCFIVDHALRSESAVEAAEVSRRLQALGLPAEILRWEHAPIASRIHGEARKARYRLLLEACHRHGITCLLFAHQREDQAETILMRLAKGSGLNGLAGIAAETAMQGVRLVRPLLTVPKDRLIATCRAEGVEFVIDPSNALDKYARGRLRRVMPLLAEEGLTVERLQDLGARAAEAREALEHFTQALLAEAARRNEFGVTSIDKPALLAAPRAIALRALSEILQTIHAEDYAPTHAALSILLDAIGSENFPPRTLNGCLVCQSKDRIVIMREPAAVTEALPIRAGESVVWDGRWRVWVGEGSLHKNKYSSIGTSPPLIPPPVSEHGAGSSGGETLKANAIYTIRALGHPPREVLDRLAPGLRHKLPQGRARASLPALWGGDEIVLIPFFAPSGQARAELVGRGP